MDGDHSSPPPRPESRSHSKVVIIVPSPKSATTPESRLLSRLPSVRSPKELVNRIDRILERNVLTPIETSTTSPEHEHPFPILNSVMYTSTSFPLLDSITAGKTTDNRLERILLTAVKEKEERAVKTLYTPSPNQQAILKIGRSRVRSWSSNYIEAFTLPTTSSLGPDMNNRPKTAPEKPVFSTTLDPRKSPMFTPVRRLKDKSYFKRTLPKQVKHYLSPNNITKSLYHGEYSANSSITTEFKDASLREESFVIHRHESNTTDGIAGSDDTSEVTALRDEHTEAVRASWLEGTTRLRKTASLMTTEDIVWLDSVQIPNAVTIAVVAYVCILFGIPPTWTQAKRSLLTNVTTFLTFLSRADPLNIPLNLLNKADKFKRLRLDALLLASDAVISRRPVQKLARWIEDFHHLVAKALHVQSAAKQYLEPYSDSHGSHPSQSLIIADAKESYASSGISSSLFFRFSAFIRVMEIKNRTVEEPRLLRDTYNCIKS